MARLFLTSGQTYSTVGAGSPVTDVFGTNSAEIVNLAADADARFDPSFARGNDTVNIAGNAGIYTAAVSGANLVLTAANGANITFPLSADGVFVKFADADVRKIYVKGSEICIGEQVVPFSGSVTVAPGSGGTGGGGETSGDPIRLTTTTDTKNGTSGNDLFIARVAQNALGEQTNELGSGDWIDGKGGSQDKLDARIQDASALNASPGAAITPETKDVEILHFEALTVGDTGKESVELNAKWIRGHNEIGSVMSDASLVIYNVTTLTNSGAYGDRRDTSAITIRMDHTDNGSDNNSQSDKSKGKYEKPLTPGVDDESDLTVLFDQDYLLCRDITTSGSTLTLELMDMDAALRDAPAKPLDQNPFGLLTFTMGGATKTIIFDNVGADTYPLLRTKIEQAIADAAVGDPILSQLVVELGDSFVATDTDSDPGGSISGTRILIRNTGPEELVAGPVGTTGLVDPNKDFHKQFYNRPPSTEDCKITSNIVLNKVGRGGDGGDLVVGGMETNGYNEWGGGGQGVEQFNIIVEGDETQPSSLASLQSTNNWLQCVYVVSAEGSKADLTIGNSKTNTYNELVNGCRDNECDVTDRRNGALKDVLVFNATGFVNDATVYGHFSDESVAKYDYINNRTLTDDGLADPTEEPHHDDSVSSRTPDNYNAVYSFGGGNDLLNMNLSKTNMAIHGTTTREDFTFSASMGGGNDTVEIQIGDGQNWRVEGRSYKDTFDIEGMGVAVGENGLQMAENWYYNHVLNQNLYIDTGANNDTVRTWGATAADINLGGGNDVAYTDNSGVRPGDFNCCRATWVFNHLDDSYQGRNVNNLQSATLGQVNNVANIGLMVTFQGIESKIAVVGNSTNGAASGVTITDLSVVQAIKNAINTDPVLSKLLVAEDGPARTLLVRSLIDGEHNEVDLSVMLVSTGALNAQQIGAGTKGLSTADLTPIGFGAGGLPSNDRFDSDFASDGGKMLTGIDSMNINNNNVEGDTGNDTIVLSSNGVGDGVGAYGSIEGNSVETIDINGVFDNDTILNFTAAVTESDLKEIQTITFTGVIPVSGVEFPSSAEGQVCLTINGQLITVDIGGLEPAPNTAEEVAAAVAAKINSDSSYATATASGGVVTVTYDQAGVDYGLLGCEIKPDTPVGEVQTITFSGGQAAAATLIVQFDGETISIDIGGATGIDTNEEIATAVRNAFNASGAAVTASVSGAVVTLTHNGDVNLPGASVAVATIGGNPQTLNWEVATTREGHPYGLDIDCATVQNGAIPARGFDIFDVNDVIGGPPQAFVNDVNARNVGNDGNEANVILGISETKRTVVLIDTLENDDYAFSSANLTEAQRIQEIFRAGDSAAPGSQDSLVITVNEDNVGFFYHVDNPNGAKDAVVTYLGSVELGFYNDTDKLAIGNWDLMTISNFTPLDAAQLVQTFDIA